MDLHSERIAGVRAQFEALVLEPMLEPFTAAFGEFGSIAADRFADLLARELQNARP